jgi:transmembrane sensor
MDASSGSAARNVQRTARAEAAAWIVRLHGPHRSAELEAAFRDWLAAHPENGTQFERVTAAWDAGSSFPVPGAPRLAHWTKPPLRRPWMWATAVFLVICALVGWSAWLAWGPTPYTTGIGEQRIVRLDDGTRLSLNSSTRVRIAYTAAERRVALERGEAYFEVARHPERPFIVTAGTHEVIALGTVFMIRYDTGQTAVTLLEGEVAVSPYLQTVPVAAPPASTETTPARINSHAPLPSASSKVILSPGERVTLTENGSLKLDAPRMEAVTAWRRGEVMLDKTALAEAVAELNRYDQTQLIIDDPRIAALPISGIYQAGDSNGFARTIAKLYNLEIVEHAQTVHLRTASGH